jgi:tetratricopeptide (TPR) repeat protein
MQGTGEGSFHLECGSKLSPGRSPGGAKGGRAERSNSAEGERHSRKGLDLLQEDSKQAVRQEFLTAITFQPEHGQALKVLKRILAEPDHFS